MEILSNTTATTTAETSGRLLSTHKKPRGSPDGRTNVPVPASTSFTSPSPAVNVKPRLPVSTGTQKLALEARCQEGSPQCPIVIDDGSDSGMSLTSQKSTAVKVIPYCPVSAKSARTPKSASVTRNGEGSAQSPIFIEVDSGSPVNQPPPPPTRVVKNMLPVPKKNDTEKPTTLSQSQSHQISVVSKSTSEPRHNNRESPISVSQPMPIRRSVSKEKGDMAPKHTEVWKGNPAFDKESQNLPALVENSPELLAKDLVRVAIVFEKKHRLATAFGIFKRANHILPKESRKLVERLGRLQEECPTAVDQAPPQELPTTAYMVKVLERDLMSVLNYGTTNELTQLHAIGTKRAELVLDKRPYQQLEELRRVPGMSANVIARLYQHHTNWKNHQ